MALSTHPTIPIFETSLLKDALSSASSNPRQFGVVGFIKRRDGRRVRGDGSWRRTVLIVVCNVDLWRLHDIHTCDSVLCSKGIPIRAPENAVLRQGRSHGIKPCSVRRGDFHVVKIRVAERGERVAVEFPLDRRPPPNEGRAPPFELEADALTRYPLAFGGGKTFEVRHICKTAHQYSLITPRNNAYQHCIPSASVNGPQGSAFASPMQNATTTAKRVKRIVARSARTQKKIRRRYVDFW
ncbi:hypothetical protein DFJ77DRAFT_474613 [Powellomyces hirtus]|nr:hypothetical protein DFJ77DRAFT_474613 [Powellomyces hirtus]